MMDLPPIADATILICTALGSALGALKYAARKNGKSTQIPHAKNGFMTLEELAEHCHNQQRTCTQLLRSEFKLMKTELRLRLEQGDRTFDAIKKELRQLNKNAKSD